MRYAAVVGCAGALSSGAPSATLRAWTSTHTADRSPRMARANARTFGPSFETARSNVSRSAVSGSASTRRAARSALRVVGSGNVPAAARRARVSLRAQGVRGDSAAMRYAPRRSPTPRSAASARARSYQACPCSASLALASRYAAAMFADMRPTGGRSRILAVSFRCVAIVRTLLTQVLGPLPRLTPGFLAQVARLWQGSQPKVRTKVLGLGERRSGAQGQDERARERAALARPRRAPA